MKIKCAMSTTRAIRHNGESVVFNSKGIGTISDANGEDLLASNPNFTLVKPTKKETSDGE